MQPLPSIKDPSTAMALYQDTLNERADSSMIFNDPKESLTVKKLTSKSRSISKHTNLMDYDTKRSNQIYESVDYPTTIAENVRSPRRNR